MKTYEHLAAFLAGNGWARPLSSWPQGQLQDLYGMVNEVWRCCAEVDALMPDADNSGGTA